MQRNRHEEEKRQRERKDWEAELAKTVGASIASRRTMARMSQENLAEELGIGLQAVSRLERGAVTPSLARLYELAAIFKCRVGDLLEDASFPPLEQTPQMLALFEGVALEDQRAMIAAIRPIAKRFKAYAARS